MALVETRANFEEALEEAKQLEAAGTHVLVNSLNPLRLQGQKTAAFEIVEELGSDAHVFFHLDAQAVATEVSGRDEAALLPESKALYSARIDPRARARVGEPIELALDAARLQFFDPESGKTLLLDASGAQAAAPELAEAAP